MHNYKYLRTVVDLWSNPLLLHTPPFGVYKNRIVALETDLRIAPMLLALALTIRPARSQGDYREAAVLIRAYAKWINVDLTFQDFENEMQSLPGKYGPPGGEMLLAFNSSGVAIGCVSLRSISAPGCCEMKRLFVTPNGRGLGAGKQLVEAIIHVARERGYQEMKLDSLPWMEQAISLYRAHGFLPTARYYENPYPEALYFGLALR